MSNGGGNGQQQVSQWEAATAAAQLQRVTMLAAQWMVGWWCNCDGDCHERRRQQWEAVMGDGNGGSMTVMGDNGGSKVDGRTAA